ncbi:hypothetical protein REPUB_Repub11eG0124400 [Reevesia pubescens]
MSSKFARFTSLVFLNLTSVGFSGTVPRQICHMSKLVSLDLSWNKYQTIDKHILGGLVRHLTKVRQLFLGGINMSSTNPNVFMNLSSSLTHLSLIWCDLRGQLPENIFHLPNLKWLELRSNSELNLYLPEFNRSNHLELLDLTMTNLSGALPDSVANLRSLKFLYLDQTSLSGVLPNSIGNLSSLKELYLSGGSLSGGLPISIGNLASLEVLLLGPCNLSGKIPRSLGNLSQLRGLRIWWNHFSREIPSSLSNLTQLESLEIAGNQVEGSIPDEVNAFPNLVLLFLYSNFLNGTLPSWLYTTSSLKKIDLQHNQLSGHINQFQCKSLERLWLNDNKFQGQIPSSIYQLVNLTTLVLSSNHLSGTVEFDMLSKLQNLEYLDLSYTNLSLNCNPTCADCSFPNLASVSLASCNIIEFPQFLRGSNNLRRLDLSNNKLHGKIPKWMWDVGKDSLIHLNLSDNSLTEVEQLPWKNIQVLDLRSNLIQGYLPIPPSATIVFLILNNNLSGQISDLICNVSSLQVLDVSFNNLSGIIPACFGNLAKRLYLLNLRMNKLQGTIPSTFAKGCKLKSINLNSNQLEGALSRSILNCRRLKILDLGNNKINGTFPHWLGNLQELQVLVLKSNQLHGSIHDARPTRPFPKLQIFALSNNSFTGKLPTKYIENFMAMMMNVKEDINVPSYIGVLISKNSAFGYYRYSVHMTAKGIEIEYPKVFASLAIIDLSSNKFQGEIPTVIGKLSLIIGLNLSHNHLIGHIPPSFGNMTNLEWLDLSSNMLDGNIPEQLLSLTLLSSLNLSNNELVGRIPEGKQFSTFENNSYEGNVGLCGFPLSRDCSSTSESEKPPEEEDQSKSGIRFGWEVVLIGYMTGFVFGSAMGYVAFRIRKPRWLMTLVEGKHRRRLKKSNKNACTRT